MSCRCQPHDSNAQSPPRGAARRRVRRAVRCARDRRLHRHALDGRGPRRLRQPRQAPPEGGGAARQGPAARQGQRRRSARGTSTSTTATSRRRTGSRRSSPRNVATSGADAARSQDCSRARPPRPSTPSTRSAARTSRTSCKRAIELSRQETVRNVEERDGSRELFTGDVIAADDAFEQAGAKLTRGLRRARRRLRRGGGRHRQLGLADHHRHRAARDRRRRRARGLGHPFGRAPRSRRSASG